MAFKFNTGGRLIVRQGSSFLPSSLADLNLWLDATDSATIASTSNNVSTWTDKSSTGAVFDSTNTVETGTQNINGKNAMYFGGSSYFESRFREVQTGNSYSIFVVAQIDAIDAGTDSLISLRGGGGGKSWQVDAAPRIGGSNSDTFAVRLGGTGSVTSKQFSSVDAPGPSIYAFVFNLATNTVEAFLDGLSLGTTAYSSSTWSGPSTNQRFLIAASRSRAEFIEGKVGELIATDSAISAMNRQKVEGYLAQKWGLKAKLPNNHPFKTGVARSTTFYINKPVPKYSFNISIRDTQANILNRVADPVGTIAYATDTFNLLVKTIDGYDQFSVVGQDYSTYSINLGFTGGGPSKYITCGDVSELDNATAFSMAFWVYMPTTPTGNQSGNQNIMSAGPDGANQIRVFKGANQEIRFQVVNSGVGAILTTTSMNPITLDAWNHVVVTYAAGTGKIYINGDKKVPNGTGLASSTHTYGSGDTFNIGRSGYSNQNYWKGLIDEFAIWDTVLDDLDITAMYNGLTADLSLASAYNTDRTSNLTHWWRMEEGSGASVVNTANIGTNDAALQNNPPFSTNTP